jgi:hypothetical protein
MAQSLTRFVECEHSIFVSYAAGDNVDYGNWPVDFAEHLKQHLKAALAPHLDQIRRDPLPEPYAFSVEGEAGGVLSGELKKRIAASFAIVVVVGKSYVNSVWCEAELRYFQQCFGATGIAERLFIVALGQEPLSEVRSKPTWQQHVPADQVCLEFFGGGIGTPYVEVQRDDGKAASREFLKRFHPLGERLQEIIRTDLDTAPEVPDAQLLIGVCVEELEDEARAFAEAARSRGMRVEQLGLRHDCEAWIKGAERLVLPFNRSAPIGLAGAGGHLAQQVALWAEFKKPADRIYGLDLSHVTGKGKAGERYLNYIDTWALPKQVPAALLATLFPPRPDPVADTVYIGQPRAKVLIESNKIEKVQWQLLQMELNDRWDELLHTVRPEPNDFPLFTGSLAIDELDSYSLDDADGLILLWGERTKPTLLSHINHVENKLRRPAPSIVAYLCPPNPHAQEAMPALQWEVLRFNQRPGDPPPPTQVAPEPDDADRLTVFLKGVLKRAQRRYMPAGGAAPRLVA